jgi:hypothetical protein
LKRKEKKKRKKKRIERGVVLREGGGKELDGDEKR